MAAERGGELLEDADVDGPVGAHPVGPARRAGVDGLGQRVGEGAGDSWASSPHRPRSAGSAYQAPGTRAACAVAVS